MGAPPGPRRGALAGLTLARRLYNTTCRIYMAHTHGDSITSSHTQTSPTTEQAGALTSAVWVKLHVLNLFEGATNLAV